MAKEKRPDPVIAELCRQIAELQEDNNRLEHQVDRLEQLQRPPSPPRQPGGSFDGDWMGG